VKMSAVLTFDLPDDQYDYEAAVNGPKIAKFLEKWEYYLRRKYKHADPENDAAYEEYSAILDKYNEMKQEYEVDEL